MSERGVRNRKRPFIFKNPDGSQTLVWTPDPGGALITGVIDGDPNVNGAPFFTSLNSFKIPSLWGVKNTAPYFHDNSALTLEDVVDHYRDFVFNKLPPPFAFTLTPQDRADIVAYLKLLPLAPRCGDSVQTVGKPSIGTKNWSCSRTLPSLPIILA